MDQPTRKYIKRQLVLHDLGIEISSDIESYYRYIKDAIGTNHRIVDKHEYLYYFDSNDLVLVYSKWKSIIVDRDLIISFSDNFDIKNMNICRNIIQYIIEHMINIQQSHGVPTFR